MLSPASMVRMEQVWRKLVRSDSSALHNTRSDRDPPFWWESLDWYPLKCHQTGPIHTLEVMHNINYGFLHGVFFMNSTKYYARLKLSCKFGEAKCNPYWDISLTTSHGTNYVLNENLDFSQHNPYAIPSEIILWYSYPASFKNQTEILVELLH